MAFEYIQKNATLTPSQVALLGTIEQQHTSFKGISRFIDLRTITGLSVVVADRTYLVEVLEESIKRIEDQISKFSNDTNRSKIFRQIERDIFSRRNWAENQLESASLLGLYSRKLLWFDNSSPTVYLFADNIKDYADSIGKSADNVFGYVFIHEMMHAYYDSYHSDGFPSWNELEEPFAEFGMLTFLKKSKLPKDLFDDAKAHVQSKIDFGPREYGFGLELFDRTGGGDPEMVKDYRAISNWIDYDIISLWKGSNKYFRDINKYLDNPSQENADKCFEGVKEILDFDWKEPSFNIQPSILGRRSTSSTRHSSYHIIPRLSRREDWAVTSYDMLYPLMITDDLDQLIVEVIKVMKNEGLETYLSFDGDKLVLLRWPFSYYATTSSKTYYTIPESLNVKGTTVFPAFKSRLLGGPALQVENILSALSTLLGGSFTIVHEGLRFVLYGPDDCLTLFSSGSKSTTSTVVPAPSVSGKSRGASYQIIDKATSRVLGTEVSMSKTTLFVIRDYCSKHPGITLADLQKTFGSVPNHTQQGLSIIESDANVSAYKTSHPGDPRKRFLEYAPISLACGDIVMITSQWADNGPRANFGAFKIAAESVGYIIK